jgi:hypothetical protein
MTNFQRIDLTTLAFVTGGQTNSTENAAQVKVKRDEVEASTSSKQTTTEPNPYLRCLDLVGRQGGWLESPNSIEGRQTRLCQPLRDALH